MPAIAWLGAAWTPLTGSIARDDTALEPCPAAIRNDALVGVRRNLLHTPRLAFQATGARSVKGELGG